MVKETNQGLVVYGTQEQVEQEVLVLMEQGYEYLATFGTETEYTIILG